MEDILAEVVHNIVYKNYDNTCDAMEEIYRDMQHQEFLSYAYRMMEMNQRRG